MYRVMIIDDEKALRNLLKASVDWQEMGLEVVVVDMNPDAVGFQTEGIEKEIIKRCILTFYSRYANLFKE